MSDLPLVVAYGGGVNSTAMLVEFSKRSIRPDVILFADTGGERPETYETVRVVSNWCVGVGFPAVVTVKYHGGRAVSDASLEAECLRLRQLPSIAYGFKSCSDKWKRRPVTAWIAANGYKHYRKAYGFDAGETRRERSSDDPNVENWFPLIEWNIWRDECLAICVQEGLPTAKSSCFFCPSMRKHEILELARSHPDLMARAIAMETQAELTTLKGLGRRFAWSDFVKADEVQAKLFDDFAPDAPCGCYDG